MIKREKLKFISFLQILGILLVVIGHSFHEYPIDHGTGTLGYRLIYSFHMPLFMWISGFLFKYTQNNAERGYKQFLKNKFHRLIVPYLFLSAITFIPRGMLGGFADSDMDVSVGGFLGSLLMYDKLVIPFFWFLQALFIIMNLSYGIRHLSSIKEDVAVFSGIVLSVIAAFFGLRYSVEFFSLGNALYFLSYFLLGYIFCKYFSIVRKMVQSWITLIVFAFVWFWAGKQCDSSFLSEVMAAFCGIVMSLSLALLVSPHIRSFGLLEGTSYMIFLLSWYPGVLCQQFLHGFTDWEWWTYSVIAVFASVLIPIAVYHFLYKHELRGGLDRKILWLLGQKKLLVITTSNLFNLKSNTMKNTVQN